MKLIPDKYYIPIFWVGVTANVISMVFSFMLSDRRGVALGAICLAVLGIGYLLREKAKEAQNDK